MKRTTVRRSVFLTSGGLVIFALALGMYTMFLHIVAGDRITAYAAYGESSGGSPGYGQGGQDTSGHTGSTGVGTSDTPSSGGPPDTEGGTSDGSGTKGGGGGSGEEPVVGNNLSFPVVSTDAYAITLIENHTFENVYTGPYTGLSDEERDALTGHTWYAQKTEENVWQADHVVQPLGRTLPIFGVDWGDNIESVNPVVGRPFRIEVTLYHAPEMPMQGYTMALLAFPSSPNEVQGTNQMRYESEYATVVSSKPHIVIQELDAESTDELIWNGTAWRQDDIVLPSMTPSFGPELNVGGKYIYGVSQGGWKPQGAGLYRITFYIPDSDISLEGAVVGNLSDWLSAPPEPGIEVEEEETRAATPIIVPEHNLTYVDVEVVTKRTGGKPDSPGEEDGEESSLDKDALATTDTLVSKTPIPSVPEIGCAPYITDYMYEGADNDPEQVTLLQEFLNDTVDANLPVTGYFGSLTTQAVKDFQELYSEDILLPWKEVGNSDMSLEEGTGYVYVTTLSKINNMMCG